MKKKKKALPEFAALYPKIIDTIAEYFTFPLPNYNDMDNNISYQPKSFYMKLLKLLKLD
jgi:hypothetical protein